jgi:NTP pyrophosphatase (non-canonical NTP hydrolase)
MKQVLEIDKIQKSLRVFAAERDWDQFHNPKNLASALIVEAAELLEIFQWLDADQAEAVLEVGPTHDKVAQELADVMIYCLRLADKLHIDLPRAIDDKIAENAAKYPVDLSKGSATKYSERGV